MAIHQTRTSPNQPARKFSEKVGADVIRGTKGKSRKLKGAVPMPTRTRESLRRTPWGSFEDLGSFSGEDPHLKLTAVLLRLQSTLLPSVSS